LEIFENAFTFFRNDAIQPHHHGGVAVVAVTKFKNEGTTLLGLIVSPAFGIIKYLSDNSSPCFSIFRACV
jgi:hypothetical protein